MIGKITTETIMTMTIMAHQIQGHVEHVAVKDNSADVCVEYNKIKNKTVRNFSKIPKLIVQFLLWK